MVDFEKFYNTALRFLSYRPRSEKEVRDCLKRHSGKEEQRLQNLLATQKNGRDSGHGQNDEGESIIEKVIAKIKEQKFINDEEFARWWIEQRTKVRPKAIRIITLELRQKGISNEIIESLLSKDLSSEEQDFDDLELAKKLIEKRIERFRNSSKQEIYQKLGSYLSRRGFDWDTIKQSIDEVVSNRV